MSEDVSAFLLAENVEDEIPPLKKCAKN